MEHELRKTMIATAERLTAKSDLSELLIGQRAIRDNTFFPRIRNGAGFTVKTYDRVMKWMEAELVKNEVTA